MRMRKEPHDSDVPFFPFRIWRSQGKEGEYLTTNHLVAQPVHLNTQAAEVLQRADGITPLEGIIAQLVERYPEAGGAPVIRSRIVQLLAFLSERELVWWRQVPAAPVPVGPPLSLFWEVTAACNLRCLHCVVGAGTKQPGELTTQRCLDLAHELAEFGVGHIAFSGGEPLARPDFRHIAERVHDLGMSVSVSTNGTLVTPEIARWLKSMEADVQVSLDGSVPEIHDYLRPGQHAYARTIAGIRHLVGAGVPLTIGTVVSMHNLADIPSILSLCQELGARRFRLIPFVPKGRGQDHSEMEISPTRMKEITLYLRALRANVTIEIIDMEFEDTMDGLTCSERQDWNRGMGCGGGVSYATITPTGELLPCHFFEGVRAISLQRTSFSRAWCESPFLNYFRHLRVSDLHGACRECSWLPKCGGSCRAANFAKGDLFGGNSHCWIANELESRVKDAREFDVVGRSFSLPVRAFDPGCTARTGAEGARGLFGFTGNEEAGD